MSVSVDQLHRDPRTGGSAWLVGDTHIRLTNAPKARDSSSASRSFWRCYSLHGPTSEWLRRRDLFKPFRTRRDLHRAICAAHALWPAPHLELPPVRRLSNGSYVIDGWQAYPESGGWRLRAPDGTQRGLLVPSLPQARRHVELAVHRAAMRAVA